MIWYLTVDCHPVSQTGNNCIWFSIVSKVSNMFENVYWSNLVDSKHRFKYVDIDLNNFSSKYIDYKTEKTWSKNTLKNEIKRYLSY